MVQIPLRKLIGGHDAVVVLKKEKSRSNVFCEPLCRESFQDPTNALLVAGCQATTGPRR